MEETRSGGGRTESDRMFSASLEPVTTVDMTRLYSVELAVEDASLIAPRPSSDATVRGGVVCCVNPLPLALCEASYDLGCADAAALALDLVHFGACRCLGPFGFWPN